MNRSYWQDCMPEILQDIGIQLTETQMNLLVEKIAMGAEMQSEYTGMFVGKYPNSTKILEEKLSRTREQLEVEACKQTCNICSGSGLDSGNTCMFCDGVGKILPDKFQKPIIHKGNTQ